MDKAQLEAVINRAWDERDAVSSATTGEIRDAVTTALEQMDSGQLRVAEKSGADWHVNQWVKKAVLLSFRLNDMATISGGPGGNAPWFDKVPSKFEGWGEAEYRAASFRAVPNCVVRHSAYIAPGVVVMPSFVNLGAYVDKGSMIDSWTTIGSCAQIGKDCHISANVVIGGVLEPLQANPVIIEDNCFVGAGSSVTEGMIIEEGAVISMGVHLGASTTIVNRATGEIVRGRVPAYSVVVPGVRDAGNGLATACAVIVKQVDEQTRSRTSTTDLLRD